MQQFSRAALLKALIPGLVLSLSLVGCKDPNAGKTDAGSGSGTEAATAATQDTNVETIKVGQYASLWSLTRASLLRWTSSMRQAALMSAARS
jgi:hypothetical protein